VAGEYNKRTLHNGVNNERKNETKITRGTQEEEKIEDKIKQNKKTKSKHEYTKKKKKKNTSNCPSRSLHLPIFSPPKPFFTPIFLHFSFYSAAHFAFRQWHA
jgi:hypothetical protein